VLAAIRTQQLPVKVILLTARRHEKDVVHGFDLGADDYVQKPFSALELVMRLKRVICKEFHIGESHHVGGKRANI
jgi:DNA-binding response OmpR family regulator